MVKNEANIRASRQYRKHVWMHENVQKRNTTTAARAMAEGIFPRGEVAVRSVWKTTLRPGVAHEIGDQSPPMRPGRCETKQNQRPEDT